MNLFKINLFTYFFILLYMLSGFYRDIFIIYLIIIIHELGHYFIMKYYKINVYKIELYPYGGMIYSDILINNNSIKSIIINIGGICFQCILFLLFYLLYRYNIIDISIYNLFNKYNTLIILFNLIPIYPLDGYKIINNILELIFNFRYCLIFSIFISIFSLVLFLLYIIINNINNYVILVYLLVNLLCYLKNYYYIINKFYLERKIYDLKYNGLISVSDKKYMYKNKYNYVNGVGEKIL